MQTKLIPVLFLATLIGLSAGCTSMLYQPTRDYYVDKQRVQEALHVEPEEVRFKNAQGVELTAWYFKHTDQRKDPRALMVHFHGNGENLSTHFFALYWILPHGFDFVVFDYQGYGKSAGTTTQEGTIEDGKAVLRWSQKRLPKTPIVVFGQSLGGAVAMKTLIELKQEVPVRLLVLEGTFLSYKSAARRALSHFWLTWPFQSLGWLLISDEFAPKERVQELAPLPVVVIHGDQDPVIDFEQGKEAFEALKDPKEFWAVPGGRHIDAFFRRDGLFQRKLLDRLKLAGL